MDKLGEINIDKDYDLDMSPIVAIAKSMDRAKSADIEGSLKSKKNGQTSTPQTSNAASFELEKTFD